MYSYSLLTFLWIVFFVKQCFILLLSYYICSLGVYTVEPMRDMSWAVLTQGVLFIYHFIVLQPLGIVSFLPFLSFSCLLKIVIIIRAYINCINITYVFCIIFLVTLKCKYIL